jgi:hypothetical protein
MHYFLAAAGMVLEECEILQDRFRGNFYELRSYWEMKDHTGHRLDIFGNEYFLDSGAFSARTRGVDITVEQYGGFVSKYSDQVVQFANLDAIPKSPSERDLARAAEQTLKNQQALEQITGRVPLPVFHKGEPIEFLREYLDHYQSICIGGLLNDVCPNRVFFNLVWQQVRRYPDGRPRQRLHAFGLAGIKHLLRYPWHSADSSSWLVSGKLGIIAVPRPGNKPGAERYDYTERPIQVPISERCGARSKNGKHFEHIGRELQGYVAEYLRGLDIRLDDVVQWPWWRFAVNMIYWMRFGEAADKLQQPKPLRQISLL